MADAPPSGDGFELAGGPRGVLLLHGFRGSARELRFLAERLAARGFSVSAPCLPGHGTRPEDLRTVRRADWEACAERSLDALRARCDRVSLVGFSMGAVLGTRLAARRPVDLRALAALAPGFHVPGIVLALGRAMLRLPFAEAAVRTRLSAIHPDVGDPEARASYGGYAWAPREARGELFDLIRAARADLPRVRAPTLALHGAGDRIVPLRSAEYMRDRLGSDVRELRVFARSRHLLHLDAEKEAVAEAIGAFLERWG